ncbi:MAG: NADH-quinone oxidoreductase subunit C [Campylobacterales bacterium]|nr:NADH-quinone oxidoreductase subunit C [Campylobacterales bacterium]
MVKIELQKDNILNELAKFYDYKRHGFMTVNGVDLGDKMEIQWIFYDYSEKNSTIVYFCLFDYEDEIPSVVSIVTPAWIAEAEVVDMFGVNIKGVNRGFFLEDDSIKMPLRKIS